MSVSTTNDIVLPERATGVLEESRKCEHCGQNFRVLHAEREEAVQCPRCRNKSKGSQKS